MSAWQRELEDLCREAEREPVDDRKFLPISPEKIPRRIVRGWKFLLTVSDEGIYHLSVSLNPAGRSSTAEDWRFLGGALAMLTPRKVDSEGKPIPLEPVGGEAAWKRDPGKPIHFRWKKDAPLPV